MFYKKVLLLFLCGFVSLCSPPSPVLNLRVENLDNTLIFPIEVLGKPGVTLSINFNLFSRQTNTKYLYLKIHNFNYPNKVGININNSGWINLNKTNTILPKQQVAFWGIDGIFSTLDCYVPVQRSSFNRLENTINFIFNDPTNRLTSGYRILDLKLIDWNDQPIDIQTKFVEDDPKNWKPIYTNLSTIIKGREIWLNATIRDNGVLLRAKCADCHAHDGSDLKYFNYSDKSIIERSIFHELSREDSKAVASYLRSLNIPYEKDARPWNPPYQPAPGMDSKPLRSWAAGGGLKAVLTNDLDTLPYLFPSGLGVGKVNFTKTLNVREVPLAVQFPDWNRWLPRIHPVDGFPDLYPSNNYIYIYHNIRSNLTTRFKTPLERARYFNSVKNLWDSYSDIDHLEPTNKLSEEYVIFKYNQTGRNKWRVIKTWEIMTEFGLQDFGNELFNSNNDRTWFHGEVFRLAPHMIGFPNFPAFYAESMQWYQLQLVLNDGNRNNHSIVPIDWGYCHALNLSSWNNPTDFITYAVMVLNIIKAGESVENRIPIDNNKGWNPQRQNINLLANENYKPKYNLIDKNLRISIAETLLHPWILKANSYSTEQWRSSKYFDEDLFYMFRRQLRLFRELEINPNLIDQFKSIAIRLWPNERWD